MADCFISYTSHDLKLAEEITRYLEGHGLSVFMAKVSLQPGARWSGDILTALRNSPWVVFLASRKACSSPCVQQEIGGAVYGGKELVPIVWDMKPSELPGWALQYQALDLRGMTFEQVFQQVEGIAQRVRAKKQNSLLIALAVFGGILLLSNNK